MPMYDYKGECGERFEALVPSRESPNPPCPHCGSEARRVPSTFSIAGSAAPPPDDSRAPRSWEGTRGGDSAVLTHWQKKLEQRQAFESKNPEFATRREAVAAHEGAFEIKPLTYKELASRAAASGDATQAASEASRDRKPVALESV